MLTRVLFTSVLISGLAAAASAEETKVAALGIADHPVTQEELESGSDLPSPRFNTPAVAYALVAEAKKGDVIVVTLVHEGGALMNNTEEVGADGAKVLVQAGKSGVPAGGWPEGTYHADVKVTRDGKPLINEKSEPVAFE